MKRIFFILFIVLAISANAQQLPTGQATPSTDQFWSRDGNLPSGSTPLSANIFGTQWNSPIYTETNGILRMKVNSSFGAAQYLINGFGWGQGVNTSGYVGIGEDEIIGGGTDRIWTNRGPFSMLHLNGENQWGVQEYGYRPWMKVGVTFTSNDDLLYIGQRKILNTFDLTDAVVVWGDNATASNVGPDNMCFIYSQGDGTGNDLNGGGMGGREIISFCSLDSFFL